MITLLMWLFGSIILLWQASMAVLEYKTFKWQFLPFFISVMIMDAIAAFIYYEAWTLDIWVVVRFLWLIAFLSFFFTWILIVKKSIRQLADRN